MSEQEEDAGKSIEIEVGTAGVKGKAQGYHLGNILQMFLVLILAAIAYMTYEVKVDAKAAAVALSTTTVKTAESLASVSKMEHDKLGVAIDKNTEATQESAYILTLNQQQRERLNLRMPESLRRRHER